MVVVSVVLIDVDDVNCVLGSRETFRIIIPFGTSESAIVVDGHWGEYMSKPADSG